MNHKGWTRGMVKYPQNASGMAIWAKNEDFGSKKNSLDFSEMEKIKNCSMCEEIQPQKIIPRPKWMKIA